MPHLSFTTALERHVRCPPAQVEGATVRAVLESYFETRPEVRGYVLDDQGLLRHHVVVFVDGAQARGLDEAVPGGADVWVMQALSGG